MAIEPLTGRTRIADGYLTLDHVPDRDDREHGDTPRVAAGWLAIAMRRADDPPGSPSSSAGVRRGAGLALVSLLGLHVRNIDLIARDERHHRATLLARALMTEVETAHSPISNLRRRFSGGLSRPLP